MGGARSGFELWGLTLARVAIPFMGMFFLWNEVILREEIRPVAIGVGFMAVAGYEAVLASVRRFGSDPGGGSSNGRRPRTVECPSTGDGADDPRPTVDRVEMSWA